MKIIIKDIKVGLEINEPLILKQAQKMLVSAVQIDLCDVESVKIKKVSLDARKKTDIHYKASVELALKGAAAQSVLKKTLPTNMLVVEEKPKQKLVYGTKKIENRPVVVGTGPCGMLAAAILAKNGYNPIIVERGKKAKERSVDVAAFWKTGALNLASNALFGEGGAGTFSDGKLTSRSKDKTSSEVLEFLVEMGAPREILFLAKPHLGTDNLQNIVQNVRKYIESKGGTYYFETCVTDIEFGENKLKAIKTNNPNLPEVITNCAIFAIGHSARDTYQMLFNKNFEMSAKAFAVGARIEHTQKLINMAQYGQINLENLDKLGAAEYVLTAQCNGRGVFSFCMCPGGTVIGCTAGESGQIVTNGMSNYMRNGKNSNSAIVVSVSPEDFGNDPLAGIEFQRQIEQKAFVAGGSNYFAPAQKVSDFLKKQKTQTFGTVKPSYTPGATGANLWEVLPEYVCKSIALAIPRFGQSIKGFDSGDAVLTGVETRTSAPLRIVRNEFLQATNNQGVFPAGEGAGYAGGIMSAAIDGVRCATALMEQFSVK